MNREKGKQCFQAKNYKKAVEYFTYATKEYPLNEMEIVYSNRSAAYYELGDFENALNDANSTIIHSPDWSKGHFRKGEALLKLNRFEEAKIAFTTASKLVQAINFKNTNTNSIWILKEKIIEADCKIEEIQQSLFFRQLLVGVDFCKKSYNPITKIINGFAKGMMNQIYLIGDQVSKECLVVDACWDVDAILKIVKSAGMNLIGGIVTHNHFDHVGGKPPSPYDKFGISVPGIKKLATNSEFKIYIGKDDYDEFTKETMITDNVIPVVDNQTLKIGKQVAQFISTPGHTPGSLCVLINGTRLLTGDTLFYNSNGRTDFKGGSLECMYNSLQKLRNLNENIVVFPAHLYGKSKTTIEHEKRFGMLQNFTFEEYKGLMNASKQGGENK